MNSIKDNIIFQKWNIETDVLDTSLHSPTHWAYSLNTYVGQYRMKTIKTKVTESIDDFKVSYTDETTNLVLIEDEKELCVMENITIWPTNYYEQFMVFHQNMTGHLYLIDSRGTIYELPYITSKNKHWEYGTVECNKRDGYYVIDKELKIYYRSKNEQKEFENRIKAINGALFNKEFNRFIRNNSHNDKNYLYLTASDNKCGALINYFSQLGMKYERVPNLLLDDETVNIRISLDDYNSREDVQFLCEKYNNAYAIYNIPISIIGGVFDIKDKHYFYTPKGKEALAYSILNTFYNVFDTNDDKKIYQKTLEKILRLFEKRSKEHSPNKFRKILLLHPNDYMVSEQYIQNNIDYINSLLETQKDNISYSEYRKAYEISKNKYKKEMALFESKALQWIMENGGKISRWKNESHLFEIVSKKYPDAIYQYHSEWLGKQSLDIFIPSLSLGIEYQGLQHYEPVDFFGGVIAFEETIERDKNKQILCKKNNINLILWKYDEVISTNVLERKINIATKEI